MKGKPAAKAAADEQPHGATAEDISHAIETITEAEFVRIHDFARNRVIRIGRRAAHGRDEDDLIQEAATRLLDGRRHWYPQKIDFIGSLLGTIKSIASEWAAHRKRNAALPEYAALESEHKKTQQESTASPFDVVAADSPNVEEQAIEADIEAERKAVAHEIVAACGEDESASMVILGWQTDMDGPAIWKDCGWAEPEYRTIVRRIQRRARKIADEYYGR
jgi:hypothetical protein